ncbi:MAG: protein translocase subunit SecF [Acidimicrobiales bacterium]
MTDAAVAPRSARSLWKRLYHGETNYDFVGRRRIGFIISGVLVLITFGSLFTRGLNLGLDFEGGVAWEVSAVKDLDADRVEQILADRGIRPNDTKIQTLASPSGGERLRIQVPDQTAEVRTAVRNDLATAAGVDPQDVSLTSVSATWGSEITAKARNALLIFLAAIAVYISLRFEWKMAVGALVAVVHDVVISVGVYSVLGFEVTPSTVIAFLTILGFSLYDTIVVFDKVHENTRRLAAGRVTYGDVVNLSMNQVLMRSLNTSLAAVLPVLSLLVVGSGILGAVALQDFALALLVGLLIGSYSSIFVATPILALLKEREPRYRAIAERLGRPTSGLDSVRATFGEAPAVADRSEGAGTAEAPVGGPATVRATAGALTHPPRPRKRKRR